MVAGCVAGGIIEDKTFVLVAGGAGIAHISINFGLFTITLVLFFSRSIGERGTCGHHFLGRFSYPDFPNFYYHPSF